MDVDNPEIGPVKLSIMKYLDEVLMEFQQMHHRYQLIFVLSQGIWRIHGLAQGSSLPVSSCEYTATLYIQ